MLIKLVLEEETINIVSAYASQIGLEESIKKTIWEDMDEIIQGVPNGEKIFMNQETLS